MNWFNLVLQWMSYIIDVEIVHEAMLIVDVLSMNKYVMKSVMIQRVTHIIVVGFLKKYKLL